MHPSFRSGAGAKSTASGLDGALAQEGRDVEVFAGLVDKGRVMDRSAGGSARRGDRNPDQGGFSVVVCIVKLLRFSELR